MIDKEKLSEVQYHGRPGLIPQALIRATNITSGAKAIYMLLSTYEEDFPKQEQIAMQEIEYKLSKSKNVTT